MLMPLKSMYDFLQGDEGELAKKIAALKWHGKELEVHVYTMDDLFVNAYPYY